MKHTLPSARPSAAPINGLEAFRRQFDRLFDDFASPMLGFGNGDLMPQTDYAETDNEIRVTAELPGVDAEDVEITLSDGALRIRGEKKFERDEEEAEYKLSERSYGSFERIMRIPEGVDADKVKADFSKGVLKVTLPKNANMRSAGRKIEIKTAQ